jgi:hypothetical protein
VTVVAPVYQSLRTLEPLCDRIKAALLGRAVEIVLADDGSELLTWQAILRLATPLPASSLSEQPSGVRQLRSLGKPR